MKVMRRDRTGQTPEQQIEVNRQELEEFQSIYHDSKDIFLPEFYFIIKGNFP